MRRYLSISLLLLMAIAISGCISGNGNEVEWTIEVYGEIPSSFEIEYAELDDMPQTSLRDSW